MDGIARFDRAVIAMTMVVMALSGCKNWPSAYANYPPAVQGSNRGGGR